MIIIILNKSKNNSFKKSKRIINKVLPKVDIRLNIGDIPYRVFIKLVKDLKKSTVKGTSVKIFIHNKECYHNFNIIQIGTKHKYLNNFDIMKVDYERFNDY